MEKDKRFEKPEIIVVSFQNEDIITESVLGWTEEGSIEIEP